MTESSRVEGALRWVDTIPFPATFRFPFVFDLRDEVLRLRAKLVEAEKTLETKKGAWTMENGYSSDRAFLCKEIGEGLKQRGFWVPKDHSSADIITAIFMALEKEKEKTESAESRCTELKESANAHRDAQIAAESRLSAYTAPVGDEDLEVALKAADMSADAIEDFNDMRQDRELVTLARALRQARVALAESQDRVRVQDQRIEQLEGALLRIAEGGHFFGTEPVRIAKEAVAPSAPKPEGERLRDYDGESY